MAGRYSDRFFEEEPVGADVLDFGPVGGPTEARPPGGDPYEARRGRPWHRSATARLAVAGAFLLGALAGAYGWDRWLATEAGAAARAEVDLTAWLTSVDYAGGEQDSVLMQVHYRNDGPHPLVVHDLALVDGLLVPVEQPEPVTVAVGDEAESSLRLQVQCGEPPLPNFELDAWTWNTPPDLELTVETADGGLQTVTRTAAMAPDLSGWFLWRCQSETSRAVFADGYGDVLSVSTDPQTQRVGASVIISTFGDGGAIAVLEVRMRSDAFAVELSETEAFPGEEISAHMAVAFRVQDCELARESVERDLTMVVRGRVDDGPEGILDIPPSSDLAAALARLAERSCADG